MSLSSVDFTKEVYVREPSFSEVCKIFSFICYKNHVIIDLVGMVTLENTTKIVKSNEKKIERNHKRCIAYFQMRLLNRHS